jgi:hypothetical protein
MSVKFDLSPEEFAQYHLNGALGKLHARVPLAPDQYRTKYPNDLYAEFVVDFKTLFEAATGFEQGAFRTVPPEGIESICLLGSVLYRHVPFQEEDVVTTAKKYVFWGPEIETSRKHVVKNKAMLSDIDVIVVTSSGLDGRDMVIPEKKISPIIERKQGSYGPYDLIIAQGIEATYHFLICNGYDRFTRDQKPSPVSLHIDYRSHDQIKKGIAQGDTVSQSLLHHGVPIIGKTSFERIVTEIGAPREPLHYVRLEETDCGALDASLHELDLKGQV